MRFIAHILWEIYSVFSCLPTSLPTLNENPEGKERHIRKHVKVRLWGVSFAFKLRYSCAGRLPFDAFRIIKKHFKENISVFN